MPILSADAACGADRRLLRTNSVDVGEGQPALASYYVQVKGPWRGCPLPMALHACSRPIFGAGRRRGCGPGIGLMAAGPRRGRGLPAGGGPAPPHGGLCRRLRGFSCSCGSHTLPVFGLNALKRARGRRNNAVGAGG